MNGATYLWWRDNQPVVRQHRHQRYTHTVVPYLDSLSNEECIDVFRLDKHGINFFSERLSNHELIHRSTVAGLPPSTQFLVPLRYYATGNSINSLKDTAGLDLSHGSVENCIKSVSKALSSFLATDVSFPFDYNSFGGHP